MDELYFTGTRLTNIHKEHVVRWGSSCDSIFSLPMTVFHQPMGSNFSWMLHRPSPFHLLTAQAGGCEYLNFFWTVKWIIGRYVLHYVSLLVVSTQVLQCITAVKCISGCLKIMPDIGLVTDMTLQFPGLHAQMTWIFSIVFIGDIWKPGSLPLKSILGRSCGKFSSEIKNTPRIFEHLQVSIPCRAELCVCQNRPFQASLVRK
jgi:hypothetical protein